MTLRYEGWTIPRIAPVNPAFTFLFTWSFTCVTTKDVAPFGKICWSGKNNVMKNYI